MYVLAVRISIGIYKQIQRYLVMVMWSYNLIKILPDRWIKISLVYPAILHSSNVPFSSIPDNSITDSLAPYVVLMFISKGKFVVLIIGSL